MILIDTLYVNSGGSKVLLDYLIAQLEKTDKEITYLFDERVRGNIPETKPTNRVVFMRASLRARNIFYKKEGENFSTVFCFGNLPPHRKLPGKVYTYFHNPLLLEFKKDMKLYRNFLYIFKMIIVNRLKNYTDFWLVQTDYIQNKLQKKYSIPKEKIQKLPFYEPFIISEKKPEKIKGQYVYASLGIPYKNHILLIEAFCRFYDKHHYGKLLLTLSEDFTELIRLIRKKQQQGYPIENMEFVNRMQVMQLFLTSEYHIFPSRTESLGLGIIESIDCDCKVIGANLPYMHAACEPSIVFDPYSTDSVFEALEKSLLPDIKPSVKKIENKINELLKMLT